MKCSLAILCMMIGCGAEAPDDRDSNPEQTKTCQGLAEALCAAASACSGPGESVSVGGMGYADEALCVESSAEYMRCAETEAAGEPSWVDVERCYQEVASSECIVEYSVMIDIPVWCMPYAVLQCSYSGDCCDLNGLYCCQGGPC